MFLISFNNPASIYHKQHTSFLRMNCVVKFGLWGFPGVSVVKNSPANAGDVDSIPRLARSPGGGNGNLLQYSFFLSLFWPKSFYFFIIFLTLQYCIGFAIYQNESATGIHVFPILNPPPSSLPYPPSGSSQCTSPKHPVPCIEPGLATRFIYDIIHVSLLSIKNEMSYYRK